MRTLAMQATSAMESLHVDVSVAIQTKALQLSASAICQLLFKQIV